MAKEEEKPFSIRLTVEQKEWCAARGSSVNAYIKELIERDILQAVGARVAGARPLSLEELEAYRDSLQPGAFDKPLEPITPVGGDLARADHPLAEAWKQDLPRTETVPRNWTMPDGEVVSLPTVVAQPWDGPKPDAAAFEEAYRAKYPEETRTLSEKARDEVGRKLPPIHQGGVDVTPRFKVGKPKGKSETVVVQDESDFFSDSQEVPEP